MIQQFRDYVRSQRPNKGRGTHTAFATMNGQEDPEGGESTASGTGTTEKRICLCGQTHSLRKCWYISSPANKPKNWKPNEATQKKVDEAISKSQRLQRVVEGIRKEVAQKQESTQLTTLITMCTFNPAAYSTSTNWDIYNSYILDSGATTHVSHI